MRTFTWIILVTLIVFGCQSKPNGEKTPANLNVITYEEFVDQVRTPSEKTKVINFWATWCKPCVEEIPAFQKAEENFRNDIDVYFVSLDVLEDQKKVEKLISKLEMKGRNYLLNETSYDNFMPKISKEWSGAIPATLFVTSDGQEFFREASYDKEQLFADISNILNEKK